VQESEHETVGRALYVSRYNAELHQRTVAIYRNNLTAVPHLPRY